MLTPGHMPGADACPGRCRAGCADAATARRSRGPYVWARLAFGRITGSLVSLVYFVETPVWVGGSAAIMCVAVVDRLLVPLEGG